jgi:hypothetical protein
MRRDLRASTSIHAARLGALAAGAAAALGCAEGATLPSAGGGSTSTHEGRAAILAGAPGSTTSPLADGTTAPALSWQGSTESGAIGTISLADYADPDGSRGINALFIDQSAAWCEVCQGLAQQLAQLVRGSWRMKGIHLLTLITQDVERGPATVDTAVSWKQHFGLDGAAVAADPNISFRDTIGEQFAPYPYQVVIDPRTMQIVSVDAGWNGTSDFPDVEDLAARNATSRP